MRRRSTISSAAEASISRRTASPLRRLCSSSRDAFEHGAAFFLLHVEVAVAGDAEGGAAEDLVAAEHAFDVGFDQLVEEEEVALAVALGQGDEARAASAGW